MYNKQFVKNATLSNPEGSRDKRICAFLASLDLTPETDADFTVNLLDFNDDIVASGSLVGNVIKYIAVSESEQGTGACAEVVSELINHAYREGITKLFIFTKPKNKALFGSFGFFALAETSDAVMMENTRNGLDSFLSSLERPQSEACALKKIGAIVANCNPMTIGHLHLINTAASSCDAVHVFILSEDRSRFSADARYSIVYNATESIGNVYVHRSEMYLVSSLTFPTYFIKDKANAADINADLDLTLFGSRIAPALGITHRFIGEEPYCAVTRAYNQRIKAILPKYGIEVDEIERYAGISASRVRELIELRRFDEIRTIVPEASYDYIIKTYGRE